jgi:hypothetical protein
MTYPINTSIPAANNDPADDQPEMQTNFGNINSYLQIDHTNPAATGAGQHKQVTFNNVTSPSTPTDPVAILYTKNDAFSHPQLNFLNSQAFASTASANGAYLQLGGIILQWGIYSVGTMGATGTQSFPVAFPNNCYSVVAIPIAKAGGTSNQSTLGIITGTITKTQFQWSLGGGPTASYQGFYFIAVGN